MDARRFVILLLVASALTGCATLAKVGRQAATSPPAATAAPTSEPAPAPVSAAAVAAPAHQVRIAMAPIPNPPALPIRRRGRRHHLLSALAPRPSGPAAIAAANGAARTPSQARDFMGGVQVFRFEPGRVYEVWTAPLRVTTLTLSPGEAVISKAAGDTVRWQIGETQSGEGQARRAHVMIKPLQRGLETNLVIATNRRIYLVELRSGAPDTFNAEVTWDEAAVLDTVATPALAAIDTTLVAPQGPLDARYRIIASRHRPVWTPSAVMTDGVHTFLAFPPGLGAIETPALVAVGADGERQFVNYRQQDGLWVVDRVLHVAELRLGGRKAQVVRIERQGGVS
jgi:type IV secretion system protein VirB9